MPDQTEPPQPGIQSSGRLRWGVFLVLLLLLAGLIWPGAGRNSTIQAAPAKGGMPLDLDSIAGLALNDHVVAALALSDTQLQAMLAGKSYDFVRAVRLGQAEAAAWRDQGCGDHNCAHVLIYNYSDGGTAEAVIHLDEGRVLARWTDAEARPSPSVHVLPRALAIAAFHPDVQSVLGDIRTITPVMAPMLIWLAHGDCRTDWCVDLTYFDPAGTGRVFHVVVNMDEGEVARTFYSRARPDRAFKRPAQTQPFTDDCYEQDGWRLCWEMTAHDGVHISDVSYQDKLIMNSVKIGQVEVWYPAWPGGYRDEIGFSASVPPQFDTTINPLDDGFEVRQLFTEFLRWPNCICCYRYEQVMRFFVDGAFEFSFISHGPGCEDLSHYRPFWRIELAEGAGEALWVWEDTAWTEMETEGEVALFSSLGPGGQKLATVSGQQSLRWLPVPTDPLGLDEAYFFALRAREGEGEGPVPTGPADTFQPPRQWIEGESLEGENLVFWYIPILRTKKGEPWWCMPDPEPDFSPCEAILRVEPAGELVQPTAEELAELAAQPTRPPVSEGTGAPQAVPIRPVQGGDAETIINAAGCGACHQIGDLGEPGKVGPDLTLIGLTASSRVPGMSSKEYIRQSILEPNLYLAPFCPNGDCLANVMPQDYALRMSEEQVEKVVDYLIDLGNRVAQEMREQGTPVATAIPAAEAATPSPEAPAGAEGEVTAEESVDTTLSDWNVLAIVLMVLGIFLVLILVVLARRQDEERA